MSVINWEEERRQFAVCDKYAYLMNAATSAMHKTVYQASRDYLDSTYYAGDPSWEPIFKILSSARALLAELAGGEAADFAFGANTNHNMNLLATCVKSRRGLGNIVTFAGEFPSTYVPWQYHGYELNRVEAREDGQVLLEDILSAIDEKTQAVVVSAVQFATGIRLDINKLGAELKQKGVPFIVNATQALGAFPVNVDTAKVDAMVCSVHKWLGAGCGASVLYASPEFREGIRWPFAGLMSFHDPEFTGSIENPKTETAFVELGVMPFQTLIAVEASLKNVLRLGINNIAERILEITDTLVEKILASQMELLTSRDSGVSLLESRNSGIIALKVLDPKTAEQELFKQNILVNERRGHLRISPHYYNNESDIDRFMAAIAGL